VNQVRVLATAAGGFPRRHRTAPSCRYIIRAGWNEGLSSGAGPDGSRAGHLRALAALYCFYAALLFGGAGSLGPALQSVALRVAITCSMPAPYVLTLAIMIRPARARNLLGRLGVECHKVKQLNGEEALLLELRAFSYESRIMNHWGKP